MRVSDADPADFTRDLVRWSETLAGIARTGLGFTQNLYERERFEEVLHVAADIKADPGQKSDIVKQHTDVATKMKGHYEQWWSVVSPRLTDFAPISIVTSAPSVLARPDSAFSIVVLPEPVPPEMMVVMRDLTAAASNSAICGLRAPISTSLLMLNGFFENFRIETSGPSTPIGRTATLTREPSSKRASQSGCDSSTRRPTAETILLMMRSRCA